MCSNEFTGFIVESKVRKIADLVEWRKEIFGVAAGYDIWILRDTVLTIELRKLFDRLPGGHHDLHVFQVVHSLLHVFKLFDAMIASGTKEHYHQGRSLL